MLATGSRDRSDYQFVDQLDAASIEGRILTVREVRDRLAFEWNGPNLPRSAMIWPNGRRVLVAGNSALEPDQVGLSPTAKIGTLKIRVQLAILPVRTDSFASNHE